MKKNNQTYYYECYHNNTKKNQNGKSQNLLEIIVEYLLLNVHKEFLRLTGMGMMTVLSVNRQTEMYYYNAIISIYNSSSTLDK